MLIEKGNLDAPILNNSDDSKPPSRISNSGYQSVTNPNNGILRMSPRSQHRFFIALQKIYEE